jgi:hypothetical protein
MAIDETALLLYYDSVLSTRFYESVTSELFEQPSI